MNGAEPHEPVSWLQLERYYLGELSPEEAAVVARAIEDDADTRECADLIRQPVELPERLERLVGLNPRPEEPGAVVPLAGVRKAARSPWPWTVLAAAAAIVLYIAVQPEPSDLDFPHARTRIKGGDVALELVRERQGRIQTAPRSFAAGDRFKVQLTCPPGGSRRFVAFVVQGDELFTPLPAMSGGQCGNLVAMPGAFSLTGSAPATVCVTWSGLALSRGPIDGDSLASVLEQAVCARLEPTPEPASSTGADDTQ